MNDLKLILRWLLHLSMAVVRRRRTLRLSPPASFLRRAYFLDRRRKGVIGVHVRDAVDNFTADQVFLYRDYDLEKLTRAGELTALNDNLVREGKTPLTLDCGGNIGLASRYFADTFAKARIVCIEPDAANMRQARANNPAAGVQFRQAAVGAEPGRGGIANPAADNNTYRIERGGAGDVDIVSINGLLAEEALADTAPFIVKIDIEGFEAELFARNTEWVSRFPLLIIELHDWMLPGSASSRSFLTEIARHDRGFEHHGQNVFSIRNCDVATAPGPA